MSASQDTQRFDDRRIFVGQRLLTCGYRFYKILQARRTLIPKLQHISHPTGKQQIRENVLNTVDQYVNCLRAHHKGGEIPEYLVSSVDAFKEQAYTNLAPQFILEDLRLDIANKIFDQNYNQK